ncbi:MAG: DHHA1 domain-containing protein [Thaumarchaeota archaeon]|nr:DHHA1 domain-containing protein [Nitrososphaerota archaeon]
MKAFCISHVKDVDGLGSAALVSAAIGAEVLLSDYDDLIDNLRRVPDDVDTFVLCDIGADNANLDGFVNQLKKIRAYAEVTYVDHHYMSEATKRRLRAAKVKLVHDVTECSSMLTYLTFRAALPERARLIALCGAVTDYMDTSPSAKKMMEQADRQFVLLEASMLAYALGRKGGQDGFPEKVVRELSKMKHPHEIEGVPELAVEQLEVVVRLGEEVKREGKVLGRLAYMVTTQHSTGNVAKLLIGAFEVPVGVSLKEKEEGWYEVSLRCTSECKAHLGRTIVRIASRLGGNGGGHKMAAGCRIPTSKADEMLQALARRV